jgi:hypothetical protein
MRVRRGSKKLSCRFLASARARNGEESAKKREGGKDQIHPNAAPATSYPATTLPWCWFDHRSINGGIMTPHRSSAMRPVAFLCVLFLALQLFGDQTTVSAAGVLPTLTLRQSLIEKADIACQKNCMYLRGYCKDQCAVFNSGSVAKIDRCKSDCDQEFRSCMCNSCSWCK